MATENKRYVVLQDSGAKEATVVRARTFSVSPSSSPEAQAYTTQQLAEVGRVPTASLSNQTKGNIAVTASGTVDSQAKTYYPTSPGISPGKSQTKRAINGRGYIQTEGSGGQARFCFKATDNSNDQLRTTYNQFHKLPQGVERHISGSNDLPSNIYCRPSLLPLQNGNLLAVYLNSDSQFWTWNYNSYLYEDAAVAGDLWNNAPSGTINLRLQTVDSRYWSTVNATTTSPLYPLSLPQEPLLDDNVYSTLVNLTGVDLVQFPDTGEVLCIYAGYFGKATTSNFTPAFLCVDQVDRDFSSQHEFCTSNQNRITNRSRNLINSIEYSGSEAGSNKPDVLGLNNVEARPLSLTAEVTPSGRLVVVVAYADAVRSFVSDDRGVTFSSNDIFEWNAGADDWQARWCTVDTTTTEDGRIVLLVVGPAMGSRGWDNDTVVPPASGPVPGSTISVFVSADGVYWGTEKKLGSEGVSFGTSLVDSRGGMTDWDTDPQKDFDGTYFDQSLHCFSGSITRTPEGFYLVSLATINLGGPGNSHSNQLFQRVLSTDEILAGQSGQDIAPAMPRTIWDSAYPLMEAVQRGQIAKYQPSVKMDDVIDNTAHKIVKSYATFCLGTVPNPTPGYVGQAFFQRVWTGSTPATRDVWKYGGGPIWAQGPIDLATCTWRDTVVTFNCGLREFEPTDFPWSVNAVNTVHSYGNVDARCRRESWIECLYSGGFQPLNARVPTWLRWNAKAIQGNLEESTDRVPYGTLVAKTRGFQFGSNSWQVSYNAPCNPFDQGWQATSSGSSSESFTFYQENNLALFRGLRTETSNFGERSYAYAGLLANKDLVFPNYQGDILKDATVRPGTAIYLDGRTALSCVGRIVVQVQKGGNFNAGTGFNSGTQIGVRCTLHSGTARISFDVRVGRSSEADDTGLGSFGVELYDAQAATTIGNFIRFDDYGNSTEALLSPWYEIMYAITPINTSTVYGTITARPWDPYADPDWLTDFASIEGNDITGQLQVDTVGSPGIDVFEFGNFPGINTGTNCIAHWGTVNFSRSFLLQSPCKIEQFQGFDSITYETPAGMEHFRESAHITAEPALGFLQNVNGGVLSPMSPPRLRSTPQMLEGGVELTFRGRETDGETFVYGAESALGAKQIFALPVGTGWRGTSTAMPSTNLNVTTTATPLPDVELMFDFGDEGVMPDSIALFGVNTDEFEIAFTDDLYSEFSLDGAEKPRCSMILSSIGGHGKKVWDYITDYFSATPPPTNMANTSFKPNYLFFWQNYSIIDGQPIAFGDNDLVASTADSTHDQSNYIVRFRRSDFLNASANGGVQDPTYGGNSKFAPFIPNQFKSSKSESFYMVIYDYSMVAPSGYTTSAENLYNNWSNGDDCNFRHVLKIKDNGTDWIELTSPIAEKFYFGQDTLPSDMVRVASLTVISDRVATNLPDYWRSLQKSANSGVIIEDTLDGYNTFRYMRLRIGGGTFYDPSENYLRVGTLIAGKRMDLSTRDIEWGWSYSLESGNVLSKGLTGQRRSRRNHRPRKVWDVSYSPKPSQDVVMVDQNSNPDDPGEIPILYQNKSRGYGQSVISLNSGNTEQLSMRSKLTWEELVERVLTLGIDGDVVALAFDGDNMVNNATQMMSMFGSQWVFNKYGQIIPALNTPGGLVAARLVGYGGAKHLGYTGKIEMASEHFRRGGTIQDGKTSIRPRPILQISGLKFSEEL